MKIRIQNLFVALALIHGFSLILADRATAQNFTTLHSFTATSVSSPFSNSDGTFPRADLIQSGNTLYGTASKGGSLNAGTVFGININGTSFTNLHSFAGSDGSLLYGGLIILSNTLYGTTVFGGSSGAGTLFSINTNGMGFTNLYSFTSNTYSASLNTYTNSDGASPYGGLISLGNTLYGAALKGGNSGKGTIFSINTDGTSFTNLHTFTTSSNDGSGPEARLIQSDGILYGTTANGGNFGNGTVFSLGTNGTGFTILHSFTNSDGTDPLAGLVLSGNTLFGTASGGGNGIGTMFSIETNGMNFTNLHSFSVADGYQPQADLFLSGNTLYGTTQHGGSSFEGNVFSVDTNGTGFTNLYSFTVLSNSTNSDGAIPQAGLILSGNTLFGTAAQGGGANNGTVFRLIIPISLFYQNIGGAVVLSWNDPSFALQAAPAVTGTYANIIGATSPYTNAITGPQQFFRLLVSQ
jgi:uncharacterized repeat protein (TIGR03803 family)